MRRLAALAVMMACLVAWPAAALAESPKAVLEGAIQKVIDILKDSKYQGKESAKPRMNAIWAVINPRFADSEMARRVLATNWKKLNPVQQKEMVELFGELLKRSYISKLEAYSGQQVAYTKEKIDGDFAQVDSVVTQREQKIPLNYRLLLLEGRWMVYDVVIDGVSLVANYRRQFNQIIVQDGVDALFKRLRDKKAEQEG